MKNTLILVENLSERAAYILGSIVSNSKIERMSNKVDYDNYSNIVIMIDKYRVISEDVNINGKEKKFLDHLLDLKIQLFDKTLKIAILFETNDVSSLNEVIFSLRDTIIGIQNCIFINKDVGNDAVFSAMDLYEEFNNKVENPKHTLEDTQKISEIIKKNSVLSISTSVNDTIHSYISEYVYIDEYIYIISNEGELFYDIYINDKVSFCILSPSKNNEINSLVCSARADVVELNSVEYINLVKNPKVKNVMNKANIDTYIIKIIPHKIKMTSI